MTKLIIEINSTLIDKFRTPRQLVPEENEINKKKKKSYKKKSETTSSSIDSSMQVRDVQFRT